MNMVIMVIIVTMVTMIIPMIITSMKSMMNMVIMIIISRMNTMMNQIKTRIRIIINMVNGYQDHPLAHSHQVFLGQHNLALDQNQDLDYDEYGHPDY